MVEAFGRDDRRRRDSSYRVLHFFHHHHGPILADLHIVWSGVTIRNSAFGQKGITVNKRRRNYIISSVQNGRILEMLDLVEKLEARLEEFGAKPDRIVPVPHEFYDGITEAEAK
jgi:hypothetical protein